MKCPKNLLTQIKPSAFEDLIAVLALFRPGPLDSGMVETYIKRRDGREVPAGREDGREGATHLQRRAESRPRARRQRDDAHAARGERRESRRRHACDA